eukprot:CAMPEP_0171249146 /NCGR_PEP_ID=MMETSP0790-20130122/49390_1 /TAXON_ID=2925 /ORGANISM="Alexandrium catenella, Strain OF101" /LENGTH=30 /DNA_ID= /DNA_START= /DNA_END= /DNA_ORIENTATION=
MKCNAWRVGFGWHDAPLAADGIHGKIHVTR